jgi:hypothetical protein
LKCVCSPNFGENVARRLVESYLFGGYFFINYTKLRRFKMNGLYIIKAIQ